MRLFLALLLFCTVPAFARHGCPEEIIDVLIVELVNSGGPQDYNEAFALIETILSQPATVAPDAPPLGHPFAAIPPSARALSPFALDYDPALAAHDRNYHYLGEKLVDLPPIEVDALNAFLRQAAIDRFPFNFAAAQVRTYAAVEDQLAPPEYSKFLRKMAYSYQASVLRALRLLALRDLALRDLGQNSAPVFPTAMRLLHSARWEDYHRSPMALTKLLVEARWIAEHDSNPGPATKWIRELPLHVADPLPNSIHRLLELP